MSRIRGANTSPELMLRRGLHARGLRFRLHRKDLPGKPDVVFPTRKAVILVNGCFWHGHGCPMFKRPATRAEFWQSKIALNQERDRKMVAALRAEGWRLLVVWECALRGPSRLQMVDVISRCEAFLNDQEQDQVAISGDWDVG